MRSRLIVPYRGVRYHLKEYSAHGSENAEEIFNHWNSSLRNVIERTLGVLKKRFSIISGMIEHFFLQLIQLLKLFWLVVYCTTIIWKLI